MSEIIKIQKLLAVIAIFLIHGFTFIVCLLIQSFLAGVLTVLFLWQKTP